MQTDGKLAQLNENRNPNHSIAQWSSLELGAGFSVPAGRGKEAIWGQVQSQISKLEMQQRFAPPLWRRGLRVAAILVPFLMIASAVTLYVLGSTHHRAMIGQQITIVLPDSSLVTLNADSHLRYNRVTWLVSRNVELQGEALFRVKKGKTFRVSAYHTRTQVLGTVFNVFSRNHEVRVTCLEGSVRVSSHPNRQNVVLTSGSKTRLASTGLEQPQTVPNESIAAWTRGEFHFTNEAIGMVFDELARQFNVEIVLNANAQRLYTGYFNVECLRRALDLVCQPMGLTWEKNGRIISISTNK